eukprot:354041-Chlamydomonas_euryale.AAC.9
MTLPGTHPSSGGARAQLQRACTAAARVHSCSARAQLQRPCIAAARVHSCSARAQLQRPCTRPPHQHWALQAGLPQPIDRAAMRPSSQAG